MKKIGNELSACLTYHLQRSVVSHHINMHYKVVIIIDITVYCIKTRSKSNQIKSHQICFGIDFHHSTDNVTEIHFPFFNAVFEDLRRQVLKQRY